MASRLGNLFSQLKNTPVSEVTVFTDLDLTTCNIYEAKYAKTNEKETDGKVLNCFMQPEIRKTLTALHSNGAEVCFVTGRHWDGVRVDDITGKKIK